MKTKTLVRYILLVIITIVIFNIAIALSAKAYYQTEQKPFNSYNLNNNRLNTFDRGVAVEPVRVQRDLHGNAYGNRYNTETNSVDFYRVNSRTGVLQIDKLEEAKRIELQAKSKYLAEQGRYKAAAKYRDSLEDELRDVRKREQRQDEQIRKANRAEYLRVGDINTEDMTAPVSLQWRTR